MGSLLLFIALAAVGIASSAYVYLRTESPGPWRARLFLLRAASFVVLALILTNPPLPFGPDGDGTPSTRWVLVDWGPALDVPHPEGGTLRDHVRGRAMAEAREGARLALVGPEPEGVDTLTLTRSEPRPTPADLGPSLRRLAEAGADSVLVLSPLRFPPASLQSTMDEAAVPVRLERAGEPVRNAGIRTLELPRRTPLGEPVEAIVTLFGEGGGAADSVTVEVEAGDTLVAVRQLRLPPAGTPRRVDLVLPPVQDTGTVRYVARVRLDGDVFPADDERVARLRGGPPEGGVLLLSLQPDWEPRVLLPVLEDATGLEGEGFLRVGEGDRWVPLAAGEESAVPVESGAFRPRLARAGLLVLHGVDAEVPGWLAEVVAEHPRVVHLPAGPAGAELAGISPAGPREGEWAVDPSLPPSPAAPYLSGIPLGGLPPLTAVRPPGAGEVTEVFRVRRGPDRESIPGFVLRSDPAGRRVIALAQGLWRWGHRDGPAREAYRGLWSGVAGWLLESEPFGGEGEIRPEPLVVARDEGFDWRVRGGGAGELFLEFRLARDDEPAAGGPRTETRTVRLSEDGRGRSRPLPPGRWRWEGEARIVSSDPDEEPTRRSGEGEVEVEPWVGALATPPVDPVPPPVAGERGGETDSVADGREGRPLRTHPVPYLLLLGLLCTEWILRRRRGLR